MKRKMSTMVLSIFMLIAALTSSGCTISSEAASTPQNLCIIAGMVQNSGRPDSKTLNTILQDAAGSDNSYISVIIPDGSPDKISLSLTIPPYKKGISESTRMKRRDQYVSQISAAMEQLKAEEEEVDILSALAFGGRELHSSNVSSGSKELVIWHSGFSTCGVFDARKSGIFDQNPEDVVAWIDENGGIPDLTDIHASWYGLGDTTPPQAKIPPRIVNWLRDFYKLLINKAGGTVDFFTDASVMTVNSNLPSVSPVEILYTETDLKEKKTDFDPNTLCSFDESTIHFLPDSAELQESPDRFLASTEELRTYMKNNSSYNLLVVGTTAEVGDLAGCRELSKQRAETIKTLFVSDGVPEGQIITSGLGYADPWHVEDKLPNGCINEELAKKNRKVVLLPASSKRAQEIMNQ